MDVGWAVPLSLAHCVCGCLNYQTLKKEDPATEKLL